jgi:uncharacterized protein
VTYRLPVKCPLCAEEQKKRAQKYFDGPRIHLAGIDDAHSYGAVEIEKAASGIHNQFFILLSQTPEVYQTGADAGFELMLSGYTHGGQICIALNAVVPRCVGAERGDMSR